MRFTLLFIAISACGFSVQGQGPVDDAKRDSAGGDGLPPADGANDAAIDAPIDARTCPPPPAGCTSFACGGTSSCYYLCGQGNVDRWADARDFCSDQNLGCLVTINDMDENNCILGNTAPVFPSLVWLGWVQASGGSEPGDGWGWQCGSSSYVAGNWGATLGEPNNVGGNEDCGAMGGLGAWIDGDCNTPLRWVCELP